MNKIDYTHFDSRQLRELFEHSKRSEQDFQGRLEARLNGAALLNADQALNPDPVMKRLGFLLARARDERRAVERELTTRRRCSDRVSQSRAV